MMKMRGAPMADFFFRTVTGRALLSVALIFTFVTGYATTARVVSPCVAASPILPDLGKRIPVLGITLPPVSKSSATNTIFCTCAPPIVPPSPCIFPGMTTLVATAFEKILLGNLYMVAGELERYLGEWVHDGMVASFLETINQAELNLIDWWDTFWFYNLYPAMQDMMKQLAVNYADQVRAIQTSYDAASLSNVKRDLEKKENEAAKAYAPNETIAAIATLAGGQIRAGTISQAMQRALQQESAQKATGAIGTAASGGYTSSQKERYDRYRRMFCDPQGAEGKNKCDTDTPPDPKYRNIDTQINKQVFARLTIDLLGSAAKPAQTAAVDTPAGLVDSAQAAANPTLGLDGPDAIPPEALPAMIENLMGSPVMDVLPKTCLTSSATCQARLLDRRSYITRYNLIRTPLDFVIGNRVPGSQMGQYVKDIRMAAGVPETSISPNPSARELMHTLTRDILGPGFALKQVTDKAALKRMKLALNVLYLQQQWEQYTLMERDNLTRAMKVAMMADKIEKTLPRFEAE